MQLFCGKQRGSICVLLTLILVPVLMFSGIIVDASRLFASKTVVSGAGDLTMNAALAQYDKKLKDTYGLTAMAKLRIHRTNSRSWSRCSKNPSTQKI